jgi:hypothetical protein
MNTRTLVGTALLAVATLTTGCSSSDHPEKPAVTVTVTTAAPTVDRAAARQACVDAWLDLFEAKGSPGIEDEPAVCDQVPGQSAEMYSDAMLQRNQANRDRMDACLEDPTCTELPVTSP